MLGTLERDRGVMPHQRVGREVVLQAFRDCCVFIRIWPYWVDDDQKRGRDAEDARQFLGDASRLKDWCHLGDLQCEAVQRQYQAARVFARDHPDWVRWRGGHISPTGQPPKAVPSRGRKLSAEIAKAIYAAKAEKVPQRIVAERFGITRNTVHAIWAGKAWLRQTGAPMD